MESEERLTPVAVKETAKHEAFLLIREGYVQAKRLLICSRCSVRFFLLLDPRDRAKTGQSLAEEQAADSFRTMIAAQHLTDHPLERLEMPRYISKD